jgi:hypothetical protein
VAGDACSGSFIRLIECYSANKIGDLRGPRCCGFRISSRSNILNGRCARTARREGVVAPHRDRCGALCVSNWEFWRRIQDSATLLDAHVLPTLIHR